MRITQLDHLVLTVRDIDATVEFYSRVLGMTVISFGAGRRALRLGNQKINLHRIGSDVGFVSSEPVPGSADLCFLTETPIEQVVDELRMHRVEILAGPVERAGATGPIRSVYSRDPDANLIEVSNRIGIHDLG